MRTITDNRRTTISLNIAPSFDDQGATMGAHAGYEIRWSTGNVPNNNALASEADYLDSAKARAEAIEPWSMVAVNRPITVPPNTTGADAAQQPRHAEHPGEPVGRGGLVRARDGGGAAQRRQRR
jgi:hypothetical protein